MPTVLITGANRGLGLEFARQYAADGWYVIAACREPKKARKLQAIDGDVTVERLDVDRQASVNRLAKAYRRAAIDVLINNAGVYGPRKYTFKNVDYGAWARVLRTNTLAPLRVAAAFLPQVARSRKRVIVTISSWLGSIAGNQTGGGYIYRTSKTAVNMAMKSLAVDLKDKGVVVAVLHPGWVKTDMGGPNALIGPEESVTGMRAAIARLRKRDSGRFINYDGKPIPW